MDNSAAGPGLGDRLRLAWQKSGRKQQAVGNDIGRSAKAIRDWMGGKIAPDYDMVMAFAKATGADPIWLWTGKGTPTFTSPTNSQPLTVEERLSRLEVGLNEVQRHLEQVQTDGLLRLIEEDEGGRDEDAGTGRTGQHSDAT